MISYKDHWSWPEAGGEQRQQLVHSWQDFTDRRLAWLYGETRAALIRKGADPATNADIARWNSLGKRDAA